MRLAKQNSQIEYVRNWLPVVRPWSLTPLTDFECLSVESLHRMLLCLNPACPLQWNRTSPSHLLVPGPMNSGFSFLPKYCFLNSCLLLMPCLFWGCQYRECLPLAGDTLTLSTGGQPAVSSARSSCQNVASEPGIKTRMQAGVFCFFWDSILCVGYTWVFIDSGKEVPLRVDLNVLRKVSPRFQNTWAFWFYSCILFYKFGPPGATNEFKAKEMVSTPHRGSACPLEAPASYNHFCFQTKRQVSGISSLRS